MKRLTPFDRRRERSELMERRGSGLPTLLAGGLLVSLPTVLLFLAAQRFVTKGLALGQF